MGEGGLPSVLLGGHPLPQLPERAPSFLLGTKVLPLSGKEGALGQQAGASGGYSGGSQAPFQVPVPQKSQAGGGLRQPLQPGSSWI